MYRYNNQFIQFIIYTLSAFYIFLYLSYKLINIILVTLTYFEYIKNKNKNTHFTNVFHSRT